MFTYKMKKKFQDFLEQRDETPHTFMSEEEYSVNSQGERAINRASHSKSNKRDMGNSDILNSNKIDFDKVDWSKKLKIDILNSKEQKICEETTCRNCNLNCGARE
jgi:hypothetical protein